MCVITYTNPYLVSLLFADPLSLYLVTFLNVFYSCTNNLRQPNLRKQIGFKHIKISPYPASNGEAEGFVQTFKHSLKASKNDPVSPTKTLAGFLLIYRSTLSSTTRVN